VHEFRTSAWIVIIWRTEIAEITRVGNSSISLNRWLREGIFRDEKEILVQLGKGGNDGDPDTIFFAVGKHKKAG
jgi:hypothetical protein